MALMEEAGWTVQDGVMKNAAGEPFAFEILLTQGANEPQQIVDIFAGALSRLGIRPGSPRSTARSSPSARTPSTST
jgi:peptide/nickel transport system substrate-binding protein